MKKYAFLDEIASFEFCPKITAKAEIDTPDSW